MGEEALVIGAVHIVLSVLVLLFFVIAANLSPKTSLGDVV
jgi:hypothetical protein